MEPIYVQLDKLQRGLITRREFLKRAAILGLTTPAVLAALEGCGQQAATTRAPGTKLTAPDPNADESKSQPIIFRGWAYETATVEDNVKKFNAEYKENVDYKTLTGDYGVIIDTMLANKEPLDLYYAHEDTIPRHAPAGRLLDFEGWWDVEKAKADMYPSIKNALSWEGKLYALPYYTAIRACIMVNKALLKKTGMETVQLKSWPEFYDLCRQMKKEGVAQTPLLHHWFAPSWAAAWQFLWECQNRGIALFDFEQEAKPLFDANHESVKVLEDWAQVFKDGLVPESVFNLQEGDYIDAFAKGEYLFSPQQTYDGKRFNDPARSNIAGMVDFATPPPGKPWGKLEIGNYTLPNRQRDDKFLARVYRLHSWFGYRDKAGKLFVAKRWALEQALGSGYKEILEDKEVLDSYAKWMPGKDRQFKDMQTYYDQVVWDRFYHVGWQSEFLNAAKAQLDPAILGKKSPKDAITDLRAEVDKVWERFRKKK